MQVHITFYLFADIKPTRVIMCGIPRGYFAGNTKNTSVTTCLIKFMRLKFGIINWTEINVQRIRI